MPIPLGTIDSCWTVQAKCEVLERFPLGFSVVHFAVAGISNPDQAEHVLSNGNDGFRMDFWSENRRIAFNYRENPFVIRVFGNYSG